MLHTKPQPENEKSTAAISVENKPSLIPKLKPSYCQNNDQIKADLDVSRSMPIKPVVYKPPECKQLNKIPPQINQKINGSQKLTLMIVLPK